jgi:predicted TIM-barrel fold metal-dependent hydrolase
MIEAGDRESVLAAEQIAKAFPGLKFVLLSMGGSSWRTAADAAEKTLNLVLEVSGSLNPDKIRIAVEKVGAHRMVFGSNMPFTDPSVTIGLVEGSDITDGEKRLIFSGTAKRLFGWGQPQPQEG